MFSWEWENFTEIVNPEDATIDDHGPLRGPICKFSARRDADLQLRMDTEAPGSAYSDPTVQRQPGTVRINDDKIIFASKHGHELKAEGVYAEHTQAHFVGIEPGVLTQNVSIHKLCGKIAPYDRPVKYVIDWLENVGSPFLLPDMITDKLDSVTTRTLGRTTASATSETLTMVGSSGRPEGRAWACVRLAVDGMQLFLCRAKVNIAQHVKEPGYIVYQGEPTDAFRDKIRRCLSYCFGVYLVHLGSSWLDDDSYLTRFEAISAYNLNGRAQELPPTPPSPLGPRSPWDVDRDVLSRMVNAIYKKYDDLNFAVVSWAYWHAVAAAPHIAAVHYGAALESLQRAYSKAESLSISQQILDLDKWQPLRKKLELCLDGSDISPEARQIFKSKIPNLNSRSQHSSAKDLVDSLGLKLSVREKSAHDSRHESAHGKDDEVDLEWIRDLKLLRIRFNRVLLAMTNAHDSYYDYFTLGQPVRNLRDPIS